MPNYYLYFLYMLTLLPLFFFFFFNDTATTEIYTLSLHDALPISRWIKARSSGLSSMIKTRSGRLIASLSGFPMQLREPFSISERGGMMRLQNKCRYRARRTPAWRLAGGRGPWAA